jgi:hypothetical protein
MRWRLLGLLVILGSPPALASAQNTDPLPPETQLVVAGGAPAPTQETFTIAAAASGTAQPDLLVTFTDFQTPAALASASVVVTQGATLVGNTTLSSGATTATLALPAAVGTFTLRVIGAPNAAAGAGTFSVCVAPKATPTACIADASLAGNISQPSTASNASESTLALTLTVTTAGAYTFTYTDDQFPVALSVAPSLALFQGSQPVSGAVPLPASPATLTLAAGTYTLLAIAEANATTTAGLYSISVTGPSGVTALVNSAYPVGTLAPAATLTNPTAQNLTLEVTDFQFPAALASASVLVTSGATVLGTATVGAGSVSITGAPAGTLQLWTYAAAGTGAGTYEVDIDSATAASVSRTAYGVAGSGTFAYAVVSPAALAAGSYTATANDFQFPSALNSVQFAVAQSDVILKQASAVGSLSFTATADPVVLLVAATPGSGGSGLLDVNVQTGGSSPQLVFDQVEPVSASNSFSSQPISLGVSGNFDVTLTDLQFPAQFQSLALVGTSQGAVLGKIYGGGTFTLDATPGTYQFTIVALPGGAQQYGLYGLQIVNSAPTVTLSASPTSVTAGATTTLSWTTNNATACTGSGGAFTGSQAVGSGSAAVSVSATTTYMLSCTGPGGSGQATATVTATQLQTGGHGGGGIGLGFASLLAMLVGVRARRQALLARRVH